ncbi:unnamed protein product [Linum trigynum]
MVLTFLPTLPHSDIDPPGCGGEPIEDEGTQAVPLNEAEEVVMAELNAELEAQKMQSASVTASSDGTAGNKKKRSQSVDDRIDFVVREMSELRPMIKQSMETIARALGESDDLIEKRTNLLKTLEELEGLTRAEILTALRKLSNNDTDLMIFYGLEDKADKLMFVTGLLG